MQYKITFLSVGDADAIIIMYKKDADTPRKIALIDAGNVSDSEKIKDFIWKTYRTRTIDLAICTHPDKDHKGGFFNLLQDDEIKIKEFWWKNPFRSLSTDDFTRMKIIENMQERAESIYNHPKDENLNLLDLAREKCDHYYHVKNGKTSEDFPITVLGPYEDLYREAAIGMVQNFAELKDDPDLTPYKEYADAENNLNNPINEKNDSSFTNTASLILLFQPMPSVKFLLCGDASCASLRQVIDNCGIDLKGCYLKVPHHGSRRNLNTDIIDDLQPIESIVSAKGYGKHPNNRIVSYLSKYGDVYSTFTSTDLYITNGIVINKAKALKQKS